MAGDLSEDRLLLIESVAALELTTCQSAVCRKHTAATLLPVLSSKFSEGRNVVVGGQPGTAGPSRPERSDGGMRRPRTPTAGSPRRGTGTRRPAARGSPAGDEHRAWLGHGGADPLRSRQEPVLRPPGLGRSSRPTTRIAEFDTMRRSTSLAVCCAPIRMMPSDRPRSAMSSSTSLIGELPSRGAYLFSSSIMVNSSPPGPACSFRAVSAASTTPTTNAARARAGYAGPQR